MMLGMEKQSGPARKVGPYKDDEKIRRARRWARLGYRGCER